MYAQDRRHLQGQKDYKQAISPETRGLCHLAVLPSCAEFAGIFLLYSHFLPFPETDTIFHHLLMSSQKPIQNSFTYTPEISISTQGTKIHGKDLFAINFHLSSGHSTSKFHLPTAILTRCGLLGIGLNKHMLSSLLISLFKSSILSCSDLSYFIMSLRS